MDRNKEIIKTSIIGIIGNMILSALKLTVGIFTNSIAIIFDAVNNMTDALSSVITIIGTRLSEKKPDKKHPFGYGRIEYLTSLTIGIIILYAGFMGVRDSLIRIFKPEPSEYSAVSIAIICAAILVKAAIGIYTGRKGRKLESASLIASGHDAINDTIATTATLAAALIYTNTGVSLEAYIGLGIAAIILKTANETLMDSVSLILGEKLNGEIITSIRNVIMTFPEVDSTFGIVLHNYGRKKLMGSANVEIPDVFRTAWTDNLQRAIKQKVYEDTGVEMLGVTVYAENMKDREIRDMRDKIRDMAGEIDFVVGIYGFYLDKVDREIRFSVMVDFEADDIEVIRRELLQKISEHYPGYKTDIVMSREL